MKKCCAKNCEEEATHRITADMDMEGIPVCKKHKSDLRADLTVALYVDGDDLWDYFYSNYNLKDHRE